MMKLNDIQEHEIKKRVLKEIINIKSEEKVKDVIVDVVLEVYKFKNIDNDFVNEVTEKVYNSMRKYGNIQEYLNDMSVTEIMINELVMLGKK